MRAALRAILSSGNARALALAWRFSDNAPVVRTDGGYWLKDS